MIGWSKTQFLDVLCEVKGFVNSFLGEDDEQFLLCAKKTQLDHLIECKNGCVLEIFVDEVSLEINENQLISILNSDYKLDKIVAGIDAYNLISSKFSQVYDLLLKPKCAEEALAMCLNLLSIRKISLIIIFDFKNLPLRSELEKSSLNDDQLFQREKFFKKADILLKDKAKLYKTCLLLIRF